MRRLARFQALLLLSAGSLTVAAASAQTSSAPVSAPAPRYVPVNPAAAVPTPAPPATPLAPATPQPAAQPPVTTTAAPPAPATASAATPKRVTPAGILAAAPADAWRRVAADRLLVMDLAGSGRVLIELAPEFAPEHVANIVTLAQARYWDGTSINRVQDNYVVQWGDPSEQKPLPADIVQRPPAEYERSTAGLALSLLPFRDSYAGSVGLIGSMPVASEGGQAWLAHCYGMVGVGRNNAPDTGTGNELYAVIGQAPRQLDRNIALVGRVLQGMEVLANRPRGTAALGFYADPAQRIGIVAVRLAADMPEAERPQLEVLRPESATFVAWVQSRANRLDDFFIRPAGALDLCNALPPVRTAPPPPQTPGPR